MRYGGCKLDMSHALAAYLSLRYLNSAAVAYFSAIAKSFILSAVAFPVLCRSENTLAEESVALRLKCAVVYRFRLLDLAVGPFSYLVGRSKTYFN